jgi:hypothetical protein
VNKFKKWTLNVNENAFFLNRNLNQVFPKVIS